MHNSNIFKALFISLLLCPIFSSAMEAELHELAASFYSFSSYLPAWISGQGPQESKMMADVRNSKEDLENKVEVQSSIPFLETVMSGLTSISIVKTPLKTMTMDLNRCSPKFCLSSHYYFIHLSFKDTIINNLNNNYQIIPTFQNARVDDYSCIGAVLVAKKASDEEKCTFIQELINRYGFEPTAKDINLALLALYDAIPAQQKEKFILLLCKHKEDELFQLADIRKQIVQWMIQLFKKEFWLLPETY